MNIVQAIRNVVANLREGAEPTAVRPAQNAVPSPDFVARREAVELTEQYIASLAGLVPAGLMPLLLQCVVHVERPLCSVPTLAEQVASHRQALSAAIHRAGLAPTPQEAQQLAQLAELEGLLAQRAAARPEEGQDRGMDWSLAQRVPQRPAGPGGPPDER